MMALAEVIARLTVLWLRGSRVPNQATELAASPATRVEVPS
jgi:hypothetical protein